MSSSSFPSLKSFRSLRAHGIAVLSASLLALSACAGVPIKKTNCWTGAPSGDVATRSGIFPSSFSLVAAVPSAADETACE